MKPDDEKKTAEEAPEAEAPKPEEALPEGALKDASGGSGVPEFRLIDDSYDEWIKWEPK